jgi:hypothetical protein
MYSTMSACVSTISLYQSTFNKSSEGGEVE